MPVFVYFLLHILGSQPPALHWFSCKSQLAIRVPHTLFHQTFLLLPRVTSVDFSAPFKLGCHSADKSLSSRRTLPKLTFPHNTGSRIYGFRLGLQSPLARVYPTAQKASDMPARTVAFFPAISKPLQYGHVSLSVRSLALPPRYARSGKSPLCLL